MDNIKRLKTIAMIPLGFTLLFLLFFGFGEILGGDTSGIGHLVPAALLAFLMWVGWKFPQWVGIGFILVAILFTINTAVSYIRTPDIDNKIMNFWPLLIIILPLLATGLLLIAAHRQEQKTLQISSPGSSTS